MSFPGRHFTCVVTPVAGELITCVLCYPTGPGPWKLVPGLLWTPPHTPFPVADSASNAFTVINGDPTHLPGPKETSSSHFDPT